MQRKKKRKKGKKRRLSGIDDDEFSDIILYFNNDDDWDEIILSQGQDFDLNEYGKFGDQNKLSSLLQHTLRTQERERDDPFAAKAAPKNMLFCISFPVLA